VGSAKAFLMGLIVHRINLKKKQEDET